MSTADDQAEALEDLRQSRIALEAALQAFHQAFRAIDRAIEWVESWEAEGP